MIYLDHAATTPMHPMVIQAMQPYLQEHFGNPSSIHVWGRKVRFALDEARETIAGFLQADPNTIVFTSGGTESDNLALFGVALANQEKGKHIITSQIEHHAILHTCAFLERFGFEITYLPVDRTGKVFIESLKEAIRSDTILVSIMYGNNEVGTIQDIAEIGHFLREQGIYFHSDAVQALGSLSIDLRELPVDLLSFSAHKINGPKGVGALYASKKVKFSPHLYGGAQERNRRAGTENVAGVVGFSESVRIAANKKEEKQKQYQSLRNRMIQVFEQSGIDYVINGHPTDSLSHILNVSFPGTDTESLLMNLDMQGIAAASGSACSSGSLEPSHVLQAMNLEPELLKSAIRFSFGMGNTEEKIVQAAEKTVNIVKKIKK